MPARHCCRTPELQNHVQPANNPKLGKSPDNYDQKFLVDAPILAQGTENLIVKELFESAEGLEIVLAVGARGFAYNATSTELTRFFDIGTPPNIQK